MNGKGNAPGDQPMAKNENSAEDVIFYLIISYQGRRGNDGQTRKN